MTSGPNKRLIHTPRSTQFRSPYESRSRTNKASRWIHDCNGEDPVNLTVCGAPIPFVAWSTDTLKQPLTHRWLRFSGWLLFDNLHVQEAENTNPNQHLCCAPATSARRYFNNHVVFFVSVLCYKCRQRLLE